MTKKGKLIVYSGPSGVGKGSILKPLLEDENFSLVLSISATTRPPRHGEIDGLHYHFVTHEQFEDMISKDKMIEYAEYNGNYYGTPREFVEKVLEQGKDVVLEIELNGALQVKERFPDAVRVFIMPPSFLELHSRLVGRGTESDEQCRGRMKIGLTEIANAHEYDFIIINRNLEESRKQLLFALNCSNALPRFHKKAITSVLNDAKSFNF